jgi:cell volume regulation protein A
MPGLLVVTWAGLRGAVPIVLATFPLTAGYPEGSLIFDVVFFVVLLSATLQGLTLGPLVRRLDLGPAERAPVDVVADIVPVDVGGVDVIELEVSAGHSVVGSRLRDRPMPAGARVAATIRGTAIEVPHGDSRILADDLLIVVVPRGDDEVAQRLEAWVDGDERPAG